MREWGLRPSGSGAGGGCCSLSEPSEKAENLLAGVIQEFCGMTGTPDGRVSLSLSLEVNKLKRGVVGCSGNYSQIHSGLEQEGSVCKLVS